MRQLRAFWHSTLGQKVVMAVTGLIMIGFLISHVLANLQVFAPDGAEKLRHYAELLRSFGGALWLVRGVLLVSLVLHVVAAWRLTQLDRAARPVTYARWEPQAATVASRTLRWGGVLLLGFIVFHLLDFTFGTVHPEFRPLEPYHNIVTGFRRPLVALFYVVAMGAVGLHLYHGAWSSFRSLGLARAKPEPRHRPVAAVLAILVALGFAIIPVAVLLGWIG
jgi:succinate dehydrogenase / fumarate reductase cytochrome b subunit